MIDPSSPSVRVNDTLSSSSVRAHVPSCCEVQSSKEAHEPVSAVGRAEERALLVECESEVCVGVEQDTIGDRNREVLIARRGCVGLAGVVLLTRWDRLTPR